MNLFIKFGLLATAFSLVPMSANAFFCGSKNNAYSQGYQNQQPMMMRTAQYGQAPQTDMMMPQPPMPPMQPAPPAFMQYPVMQANNMYQHPHYAMPAQSHPQPYVQMMHVTKPTHSTDSKQAAYGMPMQKPVAAQEANNAPQATAPQAPATESASAETAKVSINGMQFQPALVTIKAGTSVEWKNMSNMPHTVVSSDGKSLASSQMMNGGTFKHTFKEKGTYTYNCSIHPSMKGQIVVE